MNPSLLALCVWPAAFRCRAARVHAVRTGLPKSRRARSLGDALAYCDFSILKTNVLRLYVKDLSREVISLAGSSRVSGRLFTAGLQQVWVSTIARPSRLGSWD